MYNLDDKLKVTCTTPKGDVTTAELTVIDFDKQEFCGFFFPGFIENINIKDLFINYLADGLASVYKFEIEKIDIYTRLVDGLPRRFVLTGVSFETKSDYFYSQNELLDPRPINELCSILHEFYSDPKDANKLLKQGDILHLGEKFKDCVFVGENSSWSQKPTPWSIEKFDIYDIDKHSHYRKKIQFISFTESFGWSNQLLGSFEKITNEHKKTLPTQTALF